MPRIKDEQPISVAAARVYLARCENALREAAKLLSESPTNGFYNSRKEDLLYSLDNERDAQEHLDAELAKHGLKE